MAIAEEGRADEGYICERRRGSKKTKEAQEGRSVKVGAFAFAAWKQSRLDFHCAAIARPC
ncbi:hypothetical protein Dda_0392 [Drechslerella dactyloides]|uniref:Uncharacterized protein n=1 Tax=Drechslerella dactyloides TaxID=74499 RepID=A0AAD6NP30_DREDA|nr:hypothetical protein Dda_0392 [Drechslerella dactyloides]